MDNSNSNSAQGLIFTPEATEKAIKKTITKLKKKYPTRIKEITRFEAFLTNQCFRY